MTIDELRDRMSVLCGWQLIEHPIQGPLWSPGVNSSKVTAHPFPPNDLNSLAAAWPEGWRLSVLQLMDGSWWAGGCPVGGVDVIEVDEVPTRYEAELRLTVAVLEAAKP